jgi:SAM-dependent methyltransferase
MTDEPPTKRPKTLNTFEWRIFPPKNLHFVAGDSVIFKPKDNRVRSSRGIVLSVDADQNTHVDIKGQKQSVRVKELKLLFHFYDKPTIVLTTDTQNQFRRMVHQVQDHDHVLEIGCSTGETARLLIPNAHSYVGFDTSVEMVEQCSRHLGEQSHVVKMDALVDPLNAFKEAKKFGNPNVIFLDIGGNRESVNVFRMISWVLESFDPRLIVVKSVELVQSARSTTTIDDTGIMPTGAEWFEEHKTKRAIPKHPLRAPLVLSPKDGTTPICRYHNYHKKGCGKLDCAFCHGYCHFCQEPGHVARDCPTLT